METKFHLEYNEYTPLCQVFQNAYFFTAANSDNSYVIVDLKGIIVSNFMALSLESDCRREWVKQPKIKPL